MLLNPTFSDPGALPGEAAHWTFRTHCQAQRMAGFGPSPERAVEDFQRWVDLHTSFSQSDVVMAMFDTQGEGYEDFEDGWNQGTLLTELSGGIADRCIFAGSDFEDMQAGWTTWPFMSSWSDVSGDQAVFGGSPEERFEDWTPVGIPSWTRAYFDGLSTSSEDFSGSWPAMTTL